MDRQGEIGQPGRSGAGMRDLLGSLGAELAAAQERLDRSYVERLRDTEIAAASLPGVWEGLAASIAPCRPLLSEASIETELRFAGSTGEELGLAVELLSLGYRRRFAHSGLTANTTTMVVRQVPLAAASGPHAGKSSIIEEEEE